MKQVITLPEIRVFAKKLGHTFTRLPIRVRMANIPPTSTYEVTMRNYWSYVTPTDKRKKPYLGFHTILINEKYYNENKTNREELEQGIIHELAHAKVTMEDFNTSGVDAFMRVSHGADFKKAARELGADRLHQKQYWDDLHYNKKGI